VSAQTNSILTIEERLFDHSHVTPAARANDTTDIHVVRGSMFTAQPSRPFRTATIEQIQCGKVECEPQERLLGANLGLYSVTFNNDVELDRQTLEAYKAFRIEAEQKGFRHFLEVFDPNAPLSAIPEDKIGPFINDMIVRSLAGVPDSGRPLFLKMVYHGPKWTEELVSYDPHLVIGVLGGSSGTTYDAFKLISEAQKYGARVALFGRKINNAEHQLAFVEMLRRIVDGQISPEEAVRAYHSVLQGLGLKPQRSLEDDMRLTASSMSYGVSSQVRVPAVVKPAAGPGRPGGDGGARPQPAPPGGRTASPPPAAAPGAQAVGPAGHNGQMPDFRKMTKEDRLAYYRSRLAGR